MDHFKSFYWIFYNIDSVLCLVFWPQGMWNLSSLTRDWTHAPCRERQSLSPWILGKSLAPALVQNSSYSPSLPIQLFAYHSVLGNGLCSIRIQARVLGVILSCSLPHPPTSRQSWYFDPKISFQSRLSLCPHCPWRGFLPPKFLALFHQIQNVGVHLF